MEKYKLDKNIENKKIEIQMFYEQYKEATIKMRELLDERKGMATKSNEKYYQEEEILVSFNLQDPMQVIHQIHQKRTSQI